MCDVAEYPNSMYSFMNLNYSRCSFVGGNSFLVYQSLVKEVFFDTITTYDNNNSRHCLAMTIVSYSAQVTVRVFMAIVVIRKGNLASTATLC